MMTTCSIIYNVKSLGLEIFARGRGLVTLERAIDGIKIVIVLPQSRKQSVDRAPSFAVHKYNFAVHKYNFAVRKYNFAVRRSRWCRGCRGTWSRATRPPTPAAPCRS